MNICFRNCFASSILSQIKNANSFNYLHNKLTNKIILIVLIIFSSLATIYFIGCYISKREKNKKNIDLQDKQPSPQANEKVQPLPNSLDCDGNAKDQELNPSEKKGSSNDSQIMLEEEDLKIAKTVLPIVHQNSTQEGLEGEELMNGLGVKVVPDGPILNGEFVNGLLNGQGKTIYPNIVWEGDYKHGRIVGKAIVYIFKREAREAEFIYDDLRNTLKIAFINGDFWEGKFENGLLNGKGKMFYPTGEVREGDFVNNQLCGQGTLTLPDGRILKGEFKDNLLNGKGTYIYPNRVHEGNFQINNLDGKGKITFEGGEVWEGNFEGDWLHGQGKISKTNGVMIEGIFHLDPTKVYNYPNDLNGQKKVSLKNGEIWDGNYTDGLLNGTGTISFPNGEIWEGEFKDNKPHGPLLKTFPDKTTIKGTYVEGLLQDQLIKITSAEGETQEIPHKAG